MVEGRENLTNAIGLNSSMFNGARLIGPAIAGFVIAAAGEGVCFLLNALSYVAVLAALLAMRLPPQVPTKPCRSGWRRRRPAWRHPPPPVFTPVDSMAAAFTQVDSRPEASTAHRASAAEPKSL